MTPVSDSVEVIFVVQQLVFLRQHMVRQSIRSDEKTLVAILYNFQFGISALEWVQAGFMFPEGDFPGR